MTHAPKTLFRAAALVAQRPRLAGDIVVVRPLSLRTLTLVAAIIAAAVLGFLYCASYTEHVSVSGMLVPELGVIEVRALRAGRIVERHVGEGDSVMAGQRLFAVSTERESVLGSTDARVLVELERSIDSLEAELGELVALEHHERSSLRRRAKALEQEATTLSAMLATQADRVRLAEATVERYEAMRSRGYVSAEQANAKHEQLLDQRARLESLERERVVAARSLAEVLDRRIALPMRMRQERAELERTLAATRRERSEAEARRTLVVTAPVDGVATAVLGELGQVVDGSVPLVSLLPAAELEAHLYVPSSARSFVAAGDRIALRFRAYPYERFGHHEGIVVSISRAALAAHELSRGRLADAELGAGPFYRVRVALASQALSARGLVTPLQAGMTLDAELAGESRRLYQWMLDPYRKLGL